MVYWEAYLARADCNITKKLFRLKLSNIVRRFVMHISARADWTITRKAFWFLEFAMKPQATQLIMHLDSNNA